MESQELIKQLQKFIKKNRHSLSDKDIDLLQNIIIGLNDMEDNSSTDRATLLYRAAHVCDLVFRLFTDS